MLTENKYRMLLQCCHCDGKSPKMFTNIYFASSTLWVIIKIKFNNHYEVLHKQQNSINIKRFGNIVAGIIYIPMAMFAKMYCDKPTIALRSA